MQADDIKALVGRAAAEQNVRSGMKVGMGTGSTAVWAIRRIGELVGEGSLSDILVVPTSFQSTIECQKQKLSVRSLNDPQIGGMLDVTIDGADEVRRASGYHIRHSHRSSSGGTSCGFACAGAHTCPWGAPHGAPQDGSRHHRQWQPDNRCDP